MAYVLHRSHIFYTGIRFNAVEGYYCKIQTDMKNAEIEDVINTFYSFLSERGVHLDLFNSQFLRWFAYDCPQGSFSGPLLWNFFMNKL